MTSSRRVSIRELHARTGALVRQAATVGHAVVVTDRGRAIATLAPYVEHDERRSFRDRLLLPEFVALQRRIEGDVSIGISEDRSRY